MAATLSSSYPSAAAMPGTKRTGDEMVGVSKRRAPLATLTNVGATGMQTRGKALAPRTAPVAEASAAVSVAVDSPMLHDESEPDGTSFEDVHALMDVTEAEVEKAAVAFLDIDEDAGPLRGGEYIGEIHTYLRTLEQRFRPNTGYMRKQRDISHSMRAILVDWLVEVAEEYRLQPQTLYIAVGYIDRFLSEMSVQRNKLQLVGVTCMLLAAKYEEIYPPAIDEFVYITDNTYTRDQILKMEHLVLKVLRFDMGPVTILTFLQRFLHAASADDRLKCMASYIAEMTMQHGAQFMKYLPSELAAAAVSTALSMLDKPFWSPTLEHYTHYKHEALHVCMRDMHQMLLLAPGGEQQAVREKYSRPHFMNVAHVEPLPNCPV